MIDIAGSIKKMRENKHFNQKELAEQAEISRAMISRIEKGIKKPSLELTIRLADVLDCSIDELVGRKVS